MCSYNLLKTLCLFSVFITVLSDRTDDEKSRSKRTVGLILSGLSNFLNVHDELQVTTPISITTSAPNYNKRPPPPKVQKWPPLDFEITPYVLSLISAKKPPNPTPTEVPTYPPPTEEPYYQAQVFFVPLRDLENHLNSQHEYKTNSNFNTYNSISQKSQQPLPNLLYDSAYRNRLTPERYAQKHAHQSPALQSSYQTNNNNLQFVNRQSTNSTTKKKSTLHQKDIDEILEKLSSIFANPHDGELSKIAGNDVSNDKTQYMSFIDQEPRLSYRRQPFPEKNKDLLNSYLLERMQRLQNNQNSIKIPISVNNVLKKPISNTPEETNVEIIKSVEPEMRFTPDSETQSYKKNFGTNSDKGDKDIDSQIETNSDHKAAGRDDASTASYDIARSLEFPILNSSLRSNSDTQSNTKARDESYPRNSYLLTDSGIKTPPKIRNGENRKNSPIQIHFSPSIEIAKNYESEDEIHVTKIFPTAASESLGGGQPPINYQQARFLGYEENEDRADVKKFSHSDIPVRSEFRGDFRYPVPLNRPFNDNKQELKLTVDNSGVYRERNRQFTRLQRPNSESKSSSTVHPSFPTPDNVPENQYDKFYPQRPRQETQVHFFLPEEDSLRKPEQFSKPSVPNNDHEHSKTVDEYQYQRDDYYQSSPEDFENFPYQLQGGDVALKYSIPSALYSPKLPDDIHNELYNSIPRSHLGPPPAFDQDYAKSELRSNAVGLQARRVRGVFAPTRNEHFLKNKSQ